ncbi:NmrA family NAD(P)-binding protein [Mycobacterium sp. NPDC003449]
MNTILVTGATGNVGRPLVTALVDAGVRVRAVTRNPETAGFPPGVEAVRSAAEGIAGASAVFLNSRALGADLAAIVELARTGGVRRLVTLSAINADDEDARQPSRVRGDRNREVEQLAVASGLEWISLRPTVFASNFAGMWAAQIRSGDVISGPYATASTAVIVDADISAVAAVALLTDDLVGQRIPLTGPQALTNTDMVAAIGRVLNRPLHYREVAPDVVRERFVAIGFPPEFADAYVGLLADTVHRPALVTHEVDKILGRPATTFSEWVAAHRDVFTG